MSEIAEDVLQPYFKKWLTQKGIGIPVIPIQMIDYLRSNGSIIKHKSNGTTYVCEIWKCRLPNGEIKKLRFRSEGTVNKQNIGWSYSDNGIKDGVNAHFDGYKSFKSGRIRTPKFLLAHETAKDVAKVKQLKENIVAMEGFPKVIAFLKARIAFIETPTTATYKEWIKYKGVKISDLLKN